MIRLMNVHKTLGNKKVLNGISLHIKEGETFVIIGLSGSGKTVTIRHIAGFLNPDVGSVEIDGKLMNNSHQKLKDTLRRKMGFVFQSAAILNWMNVVQNVALPLVESRLFEQTEIDKRVDAILELLQLSDAKQKMPSEISGGMRQRVSLARVLVRNPEIILYDEPTTGLDPVMSNVINDLIIKMKREFKVTSVVVTHDMKSAYKIADRIAFLYHGEIIACDTPAKIRKSEHPVIQQFIKGGVKGPIGIL